MGTNHRVIAWLVASVLGVVLVGVASVVHAAELVTLWNIHAAGRSAAWQMLIDEFNASRSDIQVRLEQPATGAQGANQLLVAVAAGTPPDLVYLDRARIDELKGTGVFEALDPYIERAGWDVANEWFDRTIERLYKGGKLYGIAVDAFPLTYLAWNKRIFEEAGFDGDRPPQTYAELDQIAWQLTKRPEESGGVIQVGFDPWFSSGMTWFGIWMLLWDTWMWNPETERVSLTHPRSIELAEWHVAHAQWLQGARPSAWQGNPFVSQQLAMRVVETSSISNMENQGLDFDWGIGPMPLLPWQDRPRLYVAGEGMAMLAESRQKEQAWEVMQWLLAEEQGLRYALETGIPPARISTLRRYAAEMQSERERRMLELVLETQLVAMPSWPVGFGILDSEVFPAIRNLQVDPRSGLSEAERVLQGVVDEYIALQGPWW